MIYSEEGGGSVLVQPKTTQEDFKNLFETPGKLVLD